MLQRGSLRESIYRRKGGGDYRADNQCGRNRFMGMAKYDRLLYILNLLRTRRNLNAARLATECGVTERSIYRDILSLSEANVPVYYDNGYKLASDNFLPPLNFDFEEYTAAKLAIESTPLAAAENYREPLRRVRAKIEAGLSEVVRDRKRMAIDTTRVDIVTSVEPTEIERWFADLEEAVSDSVAVEISYNSIYSGLTKRVIEPYFIVFRGRAFYVVAFCRKRDDFRTFRIDRIRELRLTAEHFRRNAEIDPERYFDGSWELFGGEPVEVEVVFAGAAARVVQLARHHPNECIEKVDQNRIRYRVTVRGIEEIQRWLLGFGAEVEVLAPPELRRSMIETARDLTRLYGDTPG
ncbi:WYL domain-containing protein [candidate division GN15 bacterium]|nr:WYL domain-containing protein [candidate division GN15 bacterium]